MSYVRELLERSRVSVYLTEAEMQEVTRGIEAITERFTSGELDEQTCQAQLQNMAESMAGAWWARQVEGKTGT